ncbi:MAG: transcription antitermination factor NusB [Porphyromonas sp.]|nr:transcription antitermination factor NusB [Porphyromonas sp.]
MINRTLMRIKVLQILYNYYKVRGMSLATALGILRVASEDSYRLYLFLLGLPLEVSEMAEEMLGVEEEKFTQDHEVVALLNHLIRNPLIQLLGEDVALLSLRNDLNYSSSEYLLFVRRATQQIVEQLLTGAVEVEWEDFDSVRRAWRHFYGELFLDNEQFEEILSGFSTYLNDDIPIVFTFVTKAFNAVTEEKPFAEVRRPAYGSEDEERFGYDLLEAAIRGGEEYRERISHYFKNWDRERVSEMDYLILQLAMAEAIKFPLIPTTVTINEYLNLTHYYSAPHSHAFINGILHELFEDLKEEGTILGM